MWKSTLGTRWTLRPLRLCPRWEYRRDNINRMCREGKTHIAAICFLHNNQISASCQNAQCGPGTTCNTLRCSKSIALSGHTSDLETLVH
jgi:hypothetical protein